ncbi:MAG: aldo/keto reductase [Bacteroidetes bacterium]|nr:aldo/keto reductase [Bacteroidota bacterium]
MNQRNFGNTSLRVSEIGFGAWAIGGGAMVGNTAIGWGDADDESSRKAIHAAMDAGINFFDTADIYGLGHSENLIGAALGNRSDVVIATKCGNVARNEQFTTDYSKDYLIKACEQSLKRLRRDTIDYLQLHTARLQHLQNGECIEAMQQLQAEGKIRYWGISLNTFDPFPEATFLMDAKLGSGFQLVLNMINQRALPLLSSMQEKGYGVIARMPLQFGLLTGKFSTETVFPKNDHRKGRLTPEIIDRTEHDLNAVWKLCEKYNCSRAALALSYILSHDAVSTVIPGIRTTAHVEANTTGLFRLEAEDLRLIEEENGAAMEALMKDIQLLG